MASALKAFRKAEKESMDNTSRLLSRDLLPIRQLWKWKKIPAAYFQEELALEPDWPRIFTMGAGDFSIEEARQMVDHLLSPTPIEESRLAGFGLQMVPVGSFDTPLLKVVENGLFSKVYSVEAGRVFHPILLKVHSKYIQIAAMGLCPIRAELNSKGEYVVPGLRTDTKMWQRSRKTLLQAVFQGCSIAMTSVGRGRAQYKTALDSGYSSKEALAMVALFQGPSTGIDVCQDFPYKAESGGTYEDSVSRILADGDERQFFFTITRALYILSNY